MDGSGVLSLRFDVMDSKTIKATDHGALSTETATKILSQSALLERIAHTLQETQTALPVPSQEEVAALRNGGSLSVAAYLNGLLQRVILSVENAASDLRTGIEEETLSMLDEMRLSTVEINAIVAAVDERHQRPVSEK